MRILNITYKDLNWELNKVEFDVVNLIVGKNGIGKTLSMQTIDLLVKIISQKRDLTQNSDWNITFLSDSNQKINYKFGNSEIGELSIYEQLTIDGLLVLDRNSDNATILNKNSQIENDFDIIFPPKNKLAIHTNRDVKKYPFLEDISNWAEQSYGFKFGNISPYQNQQEYDFLTAVEDIPKLFQLLQTKNRKKIKDAFNRLNYNILKITVQDKSETIIFLQEDNIEKPIPHFKLSQGMFRTLAMLIFLEYLISLKKPATIIVDDLCEGLDFDRATKLGKLIFEKCLKHNIQLIATSNDSFLMEIVDLKYWNILKRTGKAVSGINAATNPELFEKFRFTGLSNFDFFASDFINQQKL